MIEAKLTGQVIGEARRTKKTDPIESVIGVGVVVDEKDKRGRWHKADKAFAFVKAVGIEACLILEALDPGTPVTVTGPITARATTAPNGSPVAKMTIALDTITIEDDK